MEKATAITIDTASNIPLGLKSEDSLDMPQARWQLPCLECICDTQTVFVPLIWQTASRLIKP